MFEDRAVHGGLEGWRAERTIAVHVESVHVGGQTPVLEHVDVLRVPGRSAESARGVMLVLASARRGTTEYLHSTTQHTTHNAGTRLLGL